ncbi:MAG: DNA methyltransferase [Chthoniobacter sp.]|uniref:DNA methyltransferase n=1 Tax=Chthoniobacter sp. TaxID=2510640 RepID=UPI0032AE07AD
MSQQNLALKNADGTGAVECLGQTFPSEEARWKHFLTLLAAKLKDPEFRRIEGFPIGKDEDILALSDPPYYTACPNPWIGDFLTAYGTPYDPKKPYHREPFVADVHEGREHPIYKAHAYHTKVPHRAIMRYILHYTEPGDVTFDGFAGTGMAGVAAQLCGDRAEVQALGYRVRDDGVILDEEGKAFSKLGARRTILNDLSPAATFIAYNYNTPVDVDAFEREAKRILKEVEDGLGWMYETKHKDGTKRRIDFTVWSEVFTCPECGGEVIFIDEALDDEAGSVRAEFPCPHCDAMLSKRKVERMFETVVDPLLGGSWKRVKFKPCLIQYRVGKTKHEKAPDADDLAILTRIEKLPLPKSVPSNLWPIEQMYHGSRIAPKGFTHTHQFFLPRPLHALAALWECATGVSDARVRAMLLYFVEQTIWGLSRMNRYSPTHFSQVNRMLNGVYYIASQHAECSPWYILDGKLKRLVGTFGYNARFKGFSQVTTASAATAALPPESLNYIFTDPPFGENIYYADMNILVESWHRVFTNTKTEAIIDEAKGKGLSEYQQLMLDCFREYFRVLKPGRWMTVEFSNSKASVWNAIQTTLQEAGFVVANVAALDKQQRSFRSVTSPTAVKQDLVISAYKPNGGLEERFAKRGETEEGVWDFTQTHLRNLPVVKARGGQLEFIAERDPRILYDRMVAFYVGHSTLVPLSSAEFQAGLAERFPQRDEMFFLSEQVNEYDKKRSQMQDIGQMSIFVEDEKSAIAWLRNELKDKPRTQQDIHPDFLQQLNASWKKWETRPELRALLEQNFLRYEGDGEVPSQIHSYLSSDSSKELRNLPKDHPQLRHKAKDRWYVPDPKKNIDVEKLRNRRLLEEFWTYLPAGYSPPALNPNRGETLPGMKVPIPKIPKGKKLKELRTEAVRVGFKECYRLKDYQTILIVAEQLPESVLNEDETLQMLYDTAVTRTGGND